MDQSSSDSASYHSILNLTQPQTSKCPSSRAHNGVIADQHSTMPPLASPQSAAAQYTTDGARLEAYTAPLALDPAQRPSADPTPPAPPAKPILASTLLSNLVRQSESHRGYRDGYDAAARERNQIRGSDRVRSGFAELDDYVLLGGVERGAVVGVSGEIEGAGGGGMGRLVCLHLLISALLSNPDAKACIIDTTGSFPVSLLANIIRLRVASQSRQTGNALKGVNNDRAPDGKVQEILCRIAISRVFDIEGVWEVLSEISSECQSRMQRRDDLNMVANAAKDPDRPEYHTAAIENLRTYSSEVEADAERETELEIGDSEAEDEDEDIEGLSMSHMGNTDLAREEREAFVTNGTHPTRETPIFGSKPSEGKGRTEIVIIDNMTTPISELLTHRERAFAHSFLSTFSRNICTLSQTHNILTLLLNTLTSPRPHSSTLGAPRHPSSRLPQKPTSIFAATTSRPALGRLFSDLCALHLLITQVPKTAKDAEALYASPPDPDAAEQQGMPIRGLPPQGQSVPRAVEYASVIEVLKDTTTHLEDWLDPGSASATPPPDARSRLLSTTTTMTAGPRHEIPQERKQRHHKRDRTQRWAPFVVSADGLALQDALGPRMAGMQTQTVKQFPFGRRV